MSAAILFRMVLFSGLFYGLYRAVLRRSLAHGWHRSYLLLAPVLSLFIPLALSNWMPPATPSVIALPGANFQYNLPEIELSSHQADGRWSWWVIAYAAGAVLYAFISLRTLVAFARIMRRCTKDARTGVYFSPYGGSAFTFLGWVVVPLSVKDTPAQTAIVMHEKEHRRLKHSLDLIFYQGFTILFWFNPFVHLLQSELKAVHEFQADAATARQIGAQKYVSTLLNSAFQTQLFTPGLSSYFNRSLIKTRIAMLTNSSASMQRARYLWVAPLCALMVALSCKRENAQEGNTPLKPASEQEAAAPSSAAVQLNEVERTPVYEGCSPEARQKEAAMCFQKAVIKHVSKAFTYPDEAKTAGIEGRLYLEFVIGTDGRSQAIKILRGNYSDSTATKAINALEAEARRVIAGLPVAKHPALQNDKPVAMSFVLPLSLKLPQ